MAMRMVFGIMRDLEEEQRQYEARASRLASALKTAHEYELVRTKARHELESDELSTSTEKAESHLRQCWKA